MTAATRLALFLAVLGAASLCVIPFTDEPTDTVLGDSANLAVATALITFSLCGLVLLRHQIKPLAWMSAPGLFHVGTALVMMGRDAPADGSGRAATIPGWGNDADIAGLVGGLLLVAASVVAIACRERRAPAD